MAAWMSFNAPICKCCMCQTIRQDLAHIDPGFDRTSRPGNGPLRGMDHVTLLYRSLTEYPAYLRAMKDKLDFDLHTVDTNIKMANLEAKRELDLSLHKEEVEIKKAELEVKKLELEIRKAHLEREKAEILIKQET
ncbi:uncharacterized protein AB675_2346 [Cyphellophora attinorum]|uniref:Uncharacterized protein n=1 Tax=Cyphellophora attinorum TaxID=1664694 RepID=A0A0N1P427_9EURO|nr:uncharacterized protein AB675_2346 [Phialophora attinorum]KPI45083.1 hypothetical protein AB675_2346 [Phialophora attinorum]